MAVSVQARFRKIVYIFRRVRSNQCSLSSVILLTENLLKACFLSSILD